MAVGDDVKHLKVGDEVFGCLPFQHMGICSPFRVGLKGKLINGRLNL